MAFAIINERSTTTYTVTLNDENGDPVPSLDSLTLTFCTGDSTIINSRNAQNVLNLNNVVFTSGVIVWSMQQADNAIVDGTANPEMHTATFDAVWNSGAGRKTWTAEFKVKDLAKITT